MYQKFKMLVVKIEPWQRTILWILGFALFSIFLYWPSLDFEILNVDDNEYVSQNLHVMRGITWDGVVWAFTTLFGGYYQPLSWLSLMLNVTCFGSKTGAFLLVNAFIHGISCAVLYFTLKQATSSSGKALLVALVTLCHPQRIESIAWAAERKDVLWVFFAILCLYAYTLYIQRQTWLLYFSTLLLFALSLLSKPSAVVVPGLLFLWNVWPMGEGFHLRSDLSAWKKAILFIKKTAHLGPFIAISLVYAIWTLKISIDFGYTLDFAKYDFIQRLGIFSLGMAGYVQNFIWPVHLGLFYVVPIFPDVSYFAPGIAVVALVLILSLPQLFRGREYIPVGILWFLIAVFPVCGLFQTGPQLFADRFSYLPSVGFAIIAVWLGSNCFRKYPKAAITGALVWISGLVLSTSLQLPNWRDAGSVWLYTVKNTENDGFPNNWFARAHLSSWFRQKNDFAQTLEYSRSIFWDKAWYLPHYNELISLISLNRIKEAEKRCNQYIAMSPTTPFFRYFKGVIHECQGDKEQALANYEQCSKLDATFLPALINQAKLFSAKGDAPNAFMMAKKAALIAPVSQDVQVLLWDICRKEHSFQDAYTTYSSIIPSIGLDVNPLYPVIFAELKAGEFSNVEPLMQQVLLHHPQNLRMQLILAEKFYEKGEKKKALDQVRQLSSRSNAAALEYLKFLLTPSPEKEPDWSSIRDVLALLPSSIVEQSSFLLWVKGESLRDSKDYLSSMQVFDQAEILAKESRNPHLLSVLAKSKKRLLDESMGMLKKK